MSQDNIVYISTKSYRSKRYHTNQDCKRIPDSSRPIEKHKLNEAYDVCEICTGEYTDGGSQYESRNCPYCGETIKMFAAHLPCEDSP